MLREQVLYQNLETWNIFLQAKLYDENLVIKWKANEITVTGSFKEKYILAHNHRTKHEEKREA